MDRILLELNSNEDPMWKYFDSQHAFIMKQMKEVYQSASASVKGACDGVQFIPSLKLFISSSGQINA